MQWLYIFLFIFCAIFGAVRLISIFYCFSIDRFTKSYEKYNKRKKTAALRHRDKK